MTIQANQGFGVSVFGAVSGGGGGSTSPGGSSGQVQYNNGGSFGGLSQLTYSGGMINVVSAPFGLSGNISSTAWTTSGIRYKNSAATLTDTSSTGTVATAYTDVFGGNTIAASNSTTFTNYYTTFISPPTAGTNVAFTGRWALGLGGALDIQAGTVTTNTTPALNITQTWNAGAVTFKGLVFNAAGLSGTNSATLSLLADFQVNGSSKAGIVKDGAIFANLGIWYSAAQSYNGSNFYGMAFASNAIDFYSPNTSGLFPVRIGYSAATAMGVAGPIGFSSTPGNAAASLDLFLTRANTATLQLGAADAAAPVAQFFKVQGVVAGTSNTAGANFTIQGSQGTGTGAGGSLIFQVSPAGSSGTAQNAYATALTIDSTKNATFTGLLSGASGFDGGINLSSGGIGSILIGNFSGGSTLTNIVAIGGGSGGYMSAGISIISSGVLGWAASTNPLAAQDTILRRDAANTLALRNGTSAQTFRVYGTTSGGNASFLSFYADPTGYTSIYNDTTGSGTFGSMFIVANAIRFQTGTSYAGRTARWQINDSGHFIAETDNTYDIGASGANRPRTGYFGSKVIAAGTGELGTNYVGGINTTLVSFISSSVVSLQPYAGPGDLRLQFGGTTSSFPALKRISSGNALQVIAADNTASAGFIVGNQALATTATDGFLYIPTCAGTPTGTPTTQTGTAPLVVDSTNNKLYVYVGGAWTAMN